jgi:hypothetical protein
MPGTLTRTGHSSTETIRELVIPAGHELTCFQAGTYRRLKVEVPVGLVNRLPSLLRLPLIGALLIYFYTENSFIDGLNEPLTWLTQQSYV